MRAIRISVLSTEDLQCVMLMAMRISVHGPVSLSLSARHPFWQPTTFTGQSCCSSWLQWCVAFTWDILFLSCRGPLGRLEVSPGYLAALLFSPEMFLVLVHPSCLRQFFLPVYSEPFLSGGVQFLFVSLSSEEEAGRLTLQSTNSFDSSPM